MKRLILTILLLLWASSAWATCNPSQAPAGSIGCFQNLSPAQGTDILYGWRPGLWPTPDMTLNVATILNLPGSTQYYPISGGPITGPVQMTGLDTSGTIAGTLCQTSSGDVLAIAGRDCYSGSGSGSVTTVSGINTNGLSWSIANPSTTPTMTLSITPSGVLKGVGGALEAAIAGADYLSAALAPANIIIGNSSNVATPVAPSGDLTMSNVGAFTVTKTSGVLFAPSATTDTTNASNITSGTLGSGILAGAYAGVTGVGTIASGTWQGTPIANSYLANSSTSVNGQACGLGGNCTIAAPAGTLTGNTLVSNVVNSSLTSAGAGFQINGNAAVFLAGAVVSGHCPEFSGTTGGLVDTGAVCGSGGSGITTLTGDVTAGPGSGSQAATLATVNSNVGTFQGLTVNAKGLVTAAVNENYLTGNQTVTLTGDTAGSGATSITTTTSKVDGVAFPSGPSLNTVPVVTNAGGGGTVTYEAVPNAALANDTISGVVLGGNLSNLTLNNSGSGAASGATFNGASAVTLSYNTLGASPLAGSSSLTTLGTISSGTWQGSLIGAAYGGTGVNNGSNTLTLGNALTFASLTGTNDLLVITSSGNVGQLATAANGVLVTSSGNVPSISSTLPSGLTIPSPIMSGTVAGNLTFSGNLTASGLLTSGTLTNFLSADGSGHIIQTAFGTGAATALGNAVNGSGGFLTYGFGYANSYGDSNTNLLATDLNVVTTGSNWTSAVTYTAQGHASYNDGVWVNITDVAQAVNVTGTLSFAAAAGDTIWGQSGVPFVMNTAGGSIRCQKYGSNWSCFGSIPPGPTTAICIGQGSGYPCAWETLAGDMTITNTGQTVVSSVHNVAFNPGVNFANQLPIGTATDVATWETVPNCGSTGNALNYTNYTSGSPFGCATFPTLGATQTWTAPQTFTNSDFLILGSSTGSTTFTSDNASSTNYILHVPAANDTFTLNAATQILTNKSIAGSEINSSTVGVTYGGTGLSGASAANGSLLIGNGSGYTLATLTAGSNVTITNSAGGITIASSGGGASGANPTATASNSAVNGSATTFMRSDAAPAIQLGSASQFGVVEADGITITATGGVLTAIGGAATSISPGSTTVVGGGAVSNGLLYDNAGVLGNLATANSGVLVTSSGGVPSISTTLPSGLAATNMTLTTPALGTPSALVCTNCTSIPGANITGTVAAAALSGRMPYCEAWITAASTITPSGCGTVSSGTWTAPSWVTSNTWFHAEVLGGGGAGGGCNTSADSGGPGVNGAMSIVDGAGLVTASTGYSFTVGAGGTGVGAGTATGALAGGNSTLAVGSGPTTYTGGGGTVGTTCLTTGAVAGATATNGITLNSVGYYKSAAATAVASVPYAVALGYGQSSANVGGGNVIANTGYGAGGYGGYSTSAGAGSENGTAGIIHIKLYGQ